MLTLQDVGGFGRMGVGCCPLVDGSIQQLLRQGLTHLSHLKRNWIQLNLLFGDLLCLAWATHLSGCSILLYKMEGWTKISVNGVSARSEGCVKCRQGRRCDSPAPSHKTLHWGDWALGLWHSAAWTRCSVNAVKGRKGRLLDLLLLAQEVADQD